MNTMTEQRAMELGAVIGNALTMPCALRSWYSDKREPSAEERFGAEGVATLMAAGYGPMVELFDQLIERAQAYGDAMHAISMWEDETRLRLGEHPNRRDLENREMECQHWLSTVQDVLAAVVWPHRDGRDEFQRVAGIYD